MPLKRSRNKHGSAQMHLTAVPARSFSSSGWTLSIISMFFFHSLVPTCDAPKDRNFVNSSRSMVRTNSPPTSLNNAQSIVVSLRSFVSSSSCTSRSLASFLPPLMTMSPMFLCFFHLPSRMTYGASVLPSWSQWRRPSDSANAMMLFPLSASTSTRDLGSSRTSM